MKLTGGGLVDKEKRWLFQGHQLLSSGHSSLLSATAHLEGLAEDILGEQELSGDGCHVAPHALPPGESILEEEGVLEDLAHGQRPLDALADVLRHKVRPGRAGQRAAEEQLRVSAQPAALPPTETLEEGRLGGATRPQNAVQGPREEAAVHSLQQRLLRPAHATVLPNAVAQVAKGQRRQW